MTGTLIKPGATLSRASMLGRKASRVAHAEFRADGGEGSRRFWARVMNYDTIDDYRTMFAPRSFEESLQARLPRVVWSHDWSEPLGRYVDYEDRSTHLDLLGEFDDFEDVPRARQAYSQLKSGTIDQFSVGFYPFDGEVVKVDGEDIFRFTRSRLDEASLVLAGSVPNTELLSIRSQGRPILVRSPQATIPKDVAAQILLDFHEGRMDLADALQSVKTAQVGEDSDQGSGGESDPTTPAGGEATPPPAGDQQPAETPPPTATTPPEPVAPAPGTPAEPPAPAPTTPEPPVTPPAEPPAEVDDDLDLDVQSILLTHGVTV